MFDLIVFYPHLCFPYSCLTSGQASQKAQVLPPLTTVQTIQAPVQTWEASPAKPRPNHKKAKAYLFLALISHFLTCLGTSSCLPRKLPQMSNKSLHTLLVCLWHHQTQHPDQFGVAGSPPTSLGLQQRKTILGLF